MPDKMLISIEDVTPLRGVEKIQEIFFLFLGYDVTGQAKKVPLSSDNEQLTRIRPQNTPLEKWFYFGASPIIKMRKNRKHVFPGGYTVFYGVPGEIVSFYFAIVESDRGARDIGKMIQSITAARAANPLIESAASLLGAASPQIAAIREAFGLIIKGLEVALINNRDDIRYTNVLTFRESDGYLVGTHDDWGNQRIAFTLQVEM
jgi:hypothetical protein